MHTMSKKQLHIIFYSVVEKILFTAIYNDHSPPCETDDSFHTLKSYLSL